jgi:hypothetical protein
MAIRGELGTGRTATTNPNPNTLTTVSPFRTGKNFIDGDGASTAWTTQNRKMIAARPGLANAPNQGRKVRLKFVPSVAAATYTVTAWIFNQGTWATPFSASSNNYTGAAEDFYDNFDDSPVFFQLSNISSGTISIYFDDQVAGAY